MERMYRALFWLAGAGVAVEFLALGVNAISAAQSVPTGAWQPYSGPSGMLTLFWIPVITSVAKYFNEGAALLGVSLAWADRRRGWFIALTVLAAAAIAFPFGFDFLLTRPEFFTVHPRVAAWLGINAALLFNTASLAPAALALIFAWRGRTSERQATRIEWDTALEITRSSL